MLAAAASSRDIAPGLLVAVSGGPDSLALLIAASELMAERPVAAATVDHALRPGSDREAACVARWCAELGVSHRTLTWDRGGASVANIQGDARAARYRLLAAEARRIGAGAVLTAHHRHDQAETHLLLRSRCAQGASLAGMRPWRDLEPGVVLLRPFLDLAPQDLGSLPRQAGWQAIQDPSNLDPRFARVRLRLALGEGERRAALDAAKAWRRLREEEGRRTAAHLSALAEAGEISVELDATIRLGIGAADDNHLLARALTAAGGALHPPPGDAVPRLRHALQRQGQATSSGCVVAQRGGEMTLSREFGRTGVPDAFAGGDGFAVFDRRFLVGPLPPGMRVLGDGANVKRRTLPAVVAADDGAAIPVALAARLGGTSSAIRAVCTLGWRLWADLPGRQPSGLTPGPQNAAKRASTVGKV